MANYLMQAGFWGWAGHLVYLLYSRWQTNFIAHQGWYMVMGCMDRAVPSYILGAGLLKFP